MGRCCSSSQYLCLADSIARYEAGSRWWNSHCCPSGGGWWSNDNHSSAAERCQEMVRGELAVYPDCRCRRCGRVLGISKHPDTADGCGELEPESLALASHPLGYGPRAHRAQCESMGCSGGKHAPLGACERDASALHRPTLHRVGRWK